MIKNSGQFETETNNPKSSTFNTTLNISLNLDRRWTRLLFASSSCTRSYSFSKQSDSLANIIDGNLFPPIRRRSFARQFMVIRSNFPCSPIKQRRNKFNPTPWNLVNSVRGLKCRPRLELRRAFASLTPVYGLTF